MKRSSKVLFFAFLAAATVICYGPFLCTAMQEPSPAAQADEQESPPGYEDEYNSWEIAEKEPDLLKRGKMLREAMAKYPKSLVMPSFEASYRNILFQCSSDEKYQELEVLAEEWAKTHSGDLITIAYLAKAAEKLGHDEKWVQSLVEIYKKQPTGDSARDVAQVYRKMKNREKYFEWMETAFKFPEYESNYLLRYDTVREFADANDYVKAAEYAQRTLKAVDLVKNPSTETITQMQAVRNACHHLIGINLMEMDKFNEAIQSFRQGIKAKDYAEGYYYTALALRKLQKIDDALPWYAKAEMMGGEVASKAKENLERLYKAKHNNTLVGIEKIYKKAQEMPPSYWTSGD
jgi:tetratricopeptide (TPR) repeat protein